jgi:ribosomal protein L32
MFNADYYETTAMLSRSNERRHLAALPECAKCGESCCPNYRLTADYQGCPTCGEWGNPAVSVGGVWVCWDKCDS